MAMLSRLPIMQPIGWESPLPQQRSNEPPEPPRKQAQRSVEHGVVDLYQKVRRRPPHCAPCDAERMALKWVVLSTAVDFLLALLVFGIGAPTS